MPRPSPSLFWHFSQIQSSIKKCSKTFRQGLNTRNPKYINSDNTANRVTTDIVSVVPATPHGDKRLHVDDDGQVEDDEADLKYGDT